MMFGYREMKLVGDGYRRFCASSVCQVLQIREPWMAIATISVLMPRGQHGFPYLPALHTPTSLESKLPCGRATPSAVACLII